MKNNNKLKIAALVYSSFKFVGGYEIFAYNLLKRLARNGHKIDLYIPHQFFTSGKAFYQQMPFSVHPLPGYVRLKSKYAPGLLTRFFNDVNEKRKHDIWQIVGAYPAGYIARLIPDETPVILRTYGQDIQKDETLNYGLRINPKMERIIVEVLKNMNCLVALTKSITACYRELGMPDDKIVEIPNGIDIDRFNIVSDKTATRQQWNIPRDKLLILTVGRHHPKKGFQLIPSVARKLKDQNIDFYWLIIGKRTNNLNAIIEKEQVNDVVKTIGEIGIDLSSQPGSEIEIPGDDLIKIYQCADIFVFPSLIEGFPRVVIEAMAAGLPVVTTDAPGCKYVLNHGDSGFLAKPGNIESLSSYIKMLILDESLRKRMSSNGLKHVQQYDWDIVVKKYEEVYLNLCEKSGSNNQETSKIKEYTIHKQFM